MPAVPTAKSAARPSALSQTGRKRSVSPSAPQLPETKGPKVPTASSSRSAAVLAQARRNDDPVYFEEQYQEEVINYMNGLDNATLASAELMDMQPELQWYMRPYLVDFLIEVHTQFRLRPEVLYLAMNIVDRYVSKRVVYKKHYQLVGCAALWIAAKFEDGKDKVPLVKELTDMCCKAYDESAFIQMEGHVLSTIGWLIGHPTAEAWLRLYTTGDWKEEPKVQHICRFLMEISLFHREFVGVQGSLVAAGALSLARFIAGKPKRAYPIMCTTSVRCAFAIDKHFHERLDQISEIVMRKYAPNYYGKVSEEVKDWYKSGRRFVYAAEPSTPVTSNPFTGLAPSSWSSKRGSWASTSPSTSISASSSEAGDEPVTPITPVHPHAHVHANDSGYFASSSSSASKENIAPPGYSAVPSYDSATGSIIPDYVSTKQVDPSHPAYAGQRGVLNPLPGTERSELPVPVPSARMLRRSSN